MGCLLAIDTSYFTLNVRATGDVEIDPENPRNVTVLPGGTARLSLLHALPKRLADEDGLLFLANLDMSDAPLAFTVGDRV